MSDERENCDREVLHLHIGSGALQIGHQCWQLYRLEHHLDVNGSLLSETNPPRCFFSERDDHNQKQYRPRALFLDDDSTAIDQMKTSQWKNFYSDDQFCHSTVFLMNSIRKQIESCDQFQGFILSHSTFGRSSTVTSELLENLINDFPKLPTISQPIVDSSVNVCHLSDLLRHTDAVLPMENQSITNLCKHRLDIPAPTYSNINRLIVHCSSTMTSSMRFDGCLFAKLEEFSTQLIPSPQYKIISSYLLPLFPRKPTDNVNIQSVPVYEMCTPLFNQPNTCFTNQVSPEKMVLSACLLFRGETIVPKDVGQRLICDLKRWMRFSDRTPTGFRCGINYHRPMIFNDQADVLALTDKQVLMLTNQTASAKYLCRLALNQTNNESEQTEMIEARNHLKEVEENYDTIEKEILNDHPFPNDRD